ncbi:MAG: mevalonate kinase family protein [Panacagrimonas sp.]
MNLTASAPGKVVLLGEYSVLEGAPAISTAVNRRATAHVNVTDSRRMRVLAPDLQSDPAEFTFRADGLRWRRPDVADRFALVGQLLRQALTEPARTGSSTGFDLILDTSAFFAANFERPRKLGLGSSAALTAACASALSAHVNKPHAVDDRNHWLGDRMLEVHRAFQNGQGSGVDVATSLFGGTIVYQRQKPLAPKILRWPSDLHYRFVWSGRSASTSAMLSKLRDWKGQHPTEYDAHMQGLCGLAEAGAVALSRTDTADLIRIADAYAEALHHLDEASNLGIVSVEHRRLSQLGRAAGLVYKCCGAGGGDIGVALTQDPERLLRFDTDLAREGFQPVPLTVDEPGLLLKLATQEEP